MGYANNNMILDSQQDYNQDENEVFDPQNQTDTWH